MGEIHDLILGRITNEQRRRAAITVVEMSGGDRERVAADLVVLGLAHPGPDGRVAVTPDEYGQSWLPVSPERPSERIHH